MAEPLELDEVKTHCRVESDDEDGLLGALIVAAREFIENYTGLYLVQRAAIDAFDCFGADVTLTAWPVVSVTSVEYLDEGAGATFADYRVLSSKRPARIFPNIGISWPSAERVPGSVIVNYIAGFDVAEVPQALRQAMLLLISHWYDAREAVVIGSTVSELPFAVEALARPHRLPVIG